MTEHATIGPGPGDNRTKLLELSATLFATQGYAQVSVRDLAARLAVTTGAIYSNFKSKGDLLAEVLEARVRADMQPPQPSLPDIWLPAAVQERFLRSSDRVQMRALLLEAGAAARTDAALRESLRPGLAALLGQWIEGYRAGQLSDKVDPDIDMATLVTVLWAIELGIGVLEAQDAVRLRLTALADIVGTFLHSLEGHDGRPTLLAGPSSAGPMEDPWHLRSNSPSAPRVHTTFDSRASSPEGSPHQATTRERLIEAAIELFAEKGYATVSVRDLARATDLTSGSIYGNFASKAVLLVEAVEVSLSRDLERVPPRLIKSGTPMELIDHHLNNFAQRKRLRALMIEGAVAARGDPDIHDRLREVQLCHQDSWCRGFERWLMAYEASPTIDTQTAVYAMWCAELGLGLLEALDVPTPAPVQTARLFGKMFSTFGLGYPSFSSMHTEGSSTRLAK